MFDFITLFCSIDDFFQKIEVTYWEFLKHCKKRLRIRSSQLKISEIVFIAIWYESYHFNNFNAFLFSLKQHQSHQRILILNKKCTLNKVHFYQIKTYRYLTIYL